MFVGIRDLDRFIGVMDNFDDFKMLGLQQQICVFFNDIMQFFKDVQINSFGVILWNNILDGVCGFLNVLLWVKNFIDCLGSQDCMDFFFDSLDQMYEMEYYF